jgi:hypothetical protein
MNPPGGDSMGTMIFWGVIVLGGFLGIILISLSSMAQKAEEVYERMPGGGTIAIQSDTQSAPASKPLSPAKRDEKRPQREVRKSAATP